MVERSWAFFDNDDSLQVAEEGIARKFKRIKGDGVKESQGARARLFSWLGDSKLDSTRAAHFPSLEGGNAAPW